MNCADCSLIQLLCRRRAGKHFANTLLQFSSRLLGKCDEQKFSDINALLAHEMRYHMLKRIRLSGTGRRLHDSVMFVIEILPNRLLVVLVHRAPPSAIFCSSPDIGTLYKTSNICLKSSPVTKRLKSRMTCLMTMPLSNEFSFFLLKYSSSA